MFQGSEKFVKAKNGRLMMKCICSECKITKTVFLKNHEGGNICSSAAKIGYELGKDPNYHRMGAVGATGHYSGHKEPWLYK